MKKGLLGSTALIGATALMAGVAGAAEAPTYKLTGNVNFQVYLPDQDLTAVPQDNGIYFAVDESELQLNVSGSADNGLNYGFKIELNANTTDTSAADEVRLQLGGGWGTLQLGDEDGAEDIMNYGGESLMGATGGFDGDQDDWYVNTGGATSFPSLAGDTSDGTKISYFSPRFSGFQVGASWTPNTGQSGGGPAIDSGDENHIGVGANYDNSFGGTRVRASAVYSADTDTGASEDTSAFSVGGILGFGPVSVAANYTDNGESDAAAGSGDESSYWNAAAAFETGPLYLSVGYAAAVADDGAGGEDEYTHLSLTADYTVAPGLGVYAQVDSISSEDVSAAVTNDGTGIIIGANVSF